MKNMKREAEINSVMKEMTMIKKMIEVEDKTGKTRFKNSYIANLKYAFT